MRVAAAMISTSPISEKPWPATSTRWTEGNFSGMGQLSDPLDSTGLSSCSHENSNFQVYHIFSHAHRRKLFFAPKGDWRAIAGGWISSKLLVPWSKHVETVGFYLAKLVYKCGTV